tara:strand:+ start:26229 stop:28283 length:2055 start_codon:yes stop_codon:yes gene_type:complete
MSYIIKSTTPFASTKLTDKGREKIAKGQLNFSTWSIGDSEINYDREVFVQGDVITGTTRVLRPKDKQPNLKSLINNNGGFNSFAFGSEDIRCIKVTVDNEADERGFFEGELATGFVTSLTGSTSGSTLPDYIRLSGGTLTFSVVNGGTTIDIGDNGAIEGDFLLLKTGYSDYTNDAPEPHLWFKVQGVAGSVITVDRELPNFSAGDTKYILYKGGQIYDNEPDSIAYWDTGTLSFDSSCDITTMDVPMWNMNIPYSVDIIGTTGTTEYEKHINYGSYDYIGQKDSYLNDVTQNLSTEQIKEDFNSMGIIHYSNKTISNLYGEFLHIDGVTKNVKIHLPDLMYHRKTFSGSTTGDKMGMTFIASGTSTTNGIGLRYVSLMEDESLVINSPIAIGRVYPDLKIIVIDDPEVLAAMSYKSNRNWTLPKFNLALSNSQKGVGSGLLNVNETIYVTYALDNESGSGITPALPNQSIAKLLNNTTSKLDVLFNIEDINLFPFMRDDDTTDGFYADTFKVLFQIVPNGGTLEADSWSQVDFTSSVSGATFIDVATLEMQSPFAVTPNFNLSVDSTSGATAYSVIDTLTMPPSASPELLQFGDERFFYGNVETFIGATIYKTIFKISINASDFRSTGNTSKQLITDTSQPNIKVSEVGIYDSDGDLVIISKLSDPVELASGKTVILELSMDF